MSERDRAIAAITLFAPHYFIAWEEGAFAVVSNSGKRALCLFKSHADGEEFAQQAIDGRYAVREMTTVGDLASLFGSPGVKGNYTHVTLNPPPDGGPFDVVEIGTYFDKAVELSGGPPPPGR
jgi:hypothetical protein